MSVIDNFFIKHNMHPDQIDFDAERTKFIAEMQKGLEGSESSLMMLPAYIKMVDELPCDKPVIAIDAGGTNLRVALITMTRNGIKIEHFNKVPMPGSKGEVTKDEFYNTIADLITPLLDYSESVSFCFSYPGEILPNQDGKALYMTKEVYIKGIEGTTLGESVNEKLNERGLKSKHFVVLNDTVAAMLSGLTHAERENHKGNIGFILGTGMNACYADNCGNIIKIADQNLPANEKMVINMESGGYDGFPRGTADKTLDSNTKDPGRYQFEKMCSGAYLGDLIYTTIKLAASEDLFSVDFNTELDKLKTLPLWDVSDFIEEPSGDNPIAQICKTDSDRDNVLNIMENIYHRSAKFSAILFAAIMEKSDIGSDKNMPVAIVAEGTTFYKSPIYTKYLNKYTEQVLNDKLGRYCTYMYVEDAALIGTAAAGLIPFF